MMTECDHFIRFTIFEKCILKTSLTLLSVFILNDKLKHHSIMRSIYKVRLSLTSNLGQIF